MSSDECSVFVPDYEVSVGKTLLGNWVEERSVAHIDLKPQSLKGISQSAFT